MKEFEALSRLADNGVKTSQNGKIIFIVGNYGLKVWASIDCLVNHYGWKTQWV